MRLVQAMKAVYQFTWDGHWSTAWRFVGIADRYAQRHTAATELELKAALGEIKVKENLRRRGGALGQSPVDHNDDGPEENDHRGPKAKAKANA